MTRPPKAARHRRGIHEARDAARGAALAALLLLLAAGIPARASGPTDEGCLECHGDDETMSMQRRGKIVSLYVKPGILNASAHAKLACIECHAGFDPEETPHKPRITPVDCRACHKDAPSKHVFHAAMPVPKGGQVGPGASCKICHGTHDVQRVAVPDTTLSAREIDAACGRCHAEEVARYEQSAHGLAAFAGQAGAPRCLHCHEKAITFARAYGDTVAYKIEQEKLCLSCHLDDPKVRARMTPGAGFIAAYDKSVHGAELHAGNAKAANCVDCHGSHEMAKGFEARSRANKMHIPATCGSCHGKIAKVYGASAHGAALAKGSVDAPVCTDCHGEHTISKAKSPESPVAPANVSEKVCSPCHSSVRLSAKYGIRSDRFRTYNDSFHGLAVRGGLVSAANCASCHGSHEILPSKDPRSSICPANLAKTCGQCHRGANTRFAAGKVHVEMAEPDEPLLYWIATIYTILIVVVVGGMFLHNAFDFFRKARHTLRVRRGLEVAREPVSRALYLRMTLSERLQHGSLMVSFTVLVVTGFMLRYPEAWWVEGLRRLWDSLFDLRSLLHRIAGVVMVVASIAHIFYLTMTTRGRVFLRDMLPRPSDLKDVAGALRYYAGLSRERPRFGRFSYVEKSEYWALVWGTVAMAGTGVILWFQDPFIALLSKLGWDVARSIHFYEAVLATLAILVWHMYFVIFNPDVYPMNLSWIKGTITEEEMEDEHPLELEAIRRKALEEEARKLRAAGTAQEGGTA